MRRYLFFIAAATAFCLIFPQTVASLVRHALLFCAVNVIPALFIFIVLSKLLSRLLPLISVPKVPGRIIQKLLGIPPILFPIFILGFLCGAPSQTFALGNLYKDGKITKNQAEKCACLVNNCSSSFIFGVCAETLESKVGAVIVFVSNIIASILVYRLLFCEKTPEKCQITTKPDIKKCAFSDLVCDSISSSAALAVSMCGYIVFFYTFAGCICECIPFSDLPAVKAVIFSFFEMTGGVFAISQIEGYLRILMTSACVSFLGLSVIFQVKSVLSMFGLSFSHFIKARIICSLLSPVISLILLFIVPADRPVFSAAFQESSFSKSPTNTLFIALLCCLIFTLFYIFGHIAKRHKKVNTK